MNLDATPETVAAVAESLKLAAILDDRITRPDKARIAAWAEQVQRHKLTRDDLLDGLQVFYDQPRDRPIGIGDLIHHARSIKRDRLDREADQAREDRRVDLDTKAADETRALAAGFITGPTPNRTPRLAAAEDSLQAVTDKHSAIAAIREYFAAKADARKPAAAQGANR